MSRTYEGEIFGKMVHQAANKETVASLDEMHTKNGTEFEINDGKITSVITPDKVMTGEKPEHYYDDPEM